MTNSKTTCGPTARLVRGEPSHHAALEAVAQRRHRLGRALGKRAWERALFFFLRRERAIRQCQSGRRVRSDRDPARLTPGDPSRGPGPSRRVPPPRHERLTVTGQQRAAVVAAPSYFAAHPPRKRRGTSRRTLIPHGHWRACLPMGVREARQAGDRLDVGTRHRPRRAVHDPCGTRWRSCMDNLRLALAPVTWASSCMCDSDDIYSGLAKSVHDEERKAAQEDAPTVLKVRRTRLSAVGDPSRPPNRVHGGNALQQSRCVRSTPLRAVTSCLSSNLRVSLVTFVLSLSNRSGQAVAITTRDCPASSAPSSHSASLRPLRAGGLDRASPAPETGQLRDGHRSIANVLSA